LPQNKRHANRRRAEEKLGQIGPEDRLSADELEGKVCANERLVSRRRWRKPPNMPLRDFINFQRKRRAMREERKRRIEALLPERARFESERGRPA
jgi:hypothetical protein